jgi:hypothetical protein
VALRDPRAELVQRQGRARLPGAVVAADCLGEGDGERQVAAVVAEQDHVDLDALRAEEARGLGAHLVQHLRDAERAGEHPAGLEQGQQAAVLGLLTAVQPRVVDRRRRLFPEAAHEVDLLGREPALSCGLDQHQHADGLAVEGERHVQARLLAPLLHGGASVVRKAGVEDGLLHDASAVQQDAVRGIIVERETHADALAGVSRRDVLEQCPADDGVLAAIVLVDDALRGLERTRRLAADERQQVVEVERGAQGATRVEQRREVAVLFFPQAVHARIVDGHCGRRCEQPYEALVGFVEAPHLALLHQGDAADRRPLEDQRNRDRRLLPPLVHQSAVHGIQLVAGVRLAEGAVAEHVLVRPALLDVDTPAHPGDVRRRHLARPTRRGDHGLADGVVLVEVALPHVEGLRDAPRDGRHDILQDERRRDGGAHLAGERVLFAARRRSSAHRLIGPSRSRVTSAAVRCRVSDRRLRATGGLMAWVSRRPWGADEPGDSDRARPRAC